MSLALSGSPVPPHLSSIATLRSMLCNSVVSGHTRRAYTKAFDDIFTLASGRAISRALIYEYRASMIDVGLSPSTINQRLCAIRKLVNEARENGLLDPAEAVRITSVPGVPQSGVRLGHWLSGDESKRLLAVPNRTRLIGKRDFAILSVLVHCALRREELANASMTRMQKRDGRWAFVDLVGKRGRRRTVPIPLAAKAAIDEWTFAAGIESGFLFRRMRKGGIVTAFALSAWSVWDVVVRSAKAAGITDLAPHDLRRTSAKLCRTAGGELDQIQALLGHADLSTTAIYLQSTQDIKNAVNDHIAL
jgi:integrase